MEIAIIADGEITTGKTDEDVTEGDVVTIEAKDENGCAIFVRGEVVEIFSQE